MGSVCLTRAHKNTAHWCGCQRASHKAFQWKTVIFCPSL
jgi:hypothetical protein